MRLALLPVLLCAACSTVTSSNPQDDKAMDYECSIEETVLAVDEASPLGFSAQQVLDVVGSPRSATFTWADGSTTDLLLTAAIAGDVIWQEATGECSSGLVFALDVTFTTADGRFDETLSIPMDVSALDPEYVFLDPYQDAGTFNGTLDLGDATDVSYVIHLHPGEWSGEVVLATTPEDGMATECGLGAWNKALETGC